MKKITIEASQAFWSFQDYKKSNTEVEYKVWGTSLYLHGNRIAYRVGDTLYISDCGWSTTTTKERLNGVLSELGYCIQQKKGDWRLVKFGEKFEDGREFEREQTGWSYANTIAINL